MSGFIEDFYYGNIEPQECNSELTPKLKKKLSNLAEKEEQLTARLIGEDKEHVLFFHGRFLSVCKMIIDYRIKGCYPCAIFVISAGTFAI